MKWIAWPKKNCARDSEDEGMRQTGRTSGPIMRTGNRTRTLDDETLASDPGQIRLSHNRLRVLRPDLYGIGGVWRSILAFFRMGWAERIYIKEQLECGDSRAAVVVSTTPLLVAAYSEDLDCIAMLRFPGELVDQYRLSIGTRLLTVNCYGDSGEYDRDLILGRKLDGGWTGFHPLIAEFLSDDGDRIEARKREITEEEWQRAYGMGVRYIKARPGVARDGRPVYSSIPASGRRGRRRQAHEQSGSTVELQA